MSWAKDRIDGYRQGQPASWLERRMLEHANPVHFALALASFVVLVSGLWLHNWAWIISALVLSLVGHVYCWMWGRRTLP
jgi:hypothetical protein